MKANELRIGNWIIEDETIYSYGISKTKRQISLNDFRVSDDNWSDLWDMFKPIPLTEEILLKCGFGKSDEHEMGHNYNETFGFYYDYHFKRFRLECDDGIKHGAEMSLDIQFLHQLQNLYFALTNEELEIKL